MLSRSYASGGLFLDALKFPRLSKCWWAGAKLIYQLFTKHPSTGGFDSCKFSLCLSLFLCDVCWSTVFYLTCQLSLQSQIRFNVHFYIRLIILNLSPHSHFYLWNPSKWFSKMKCALSREIFWVMGFEPMTQDDKIYHLDDWTDFWTKASTWSQSCKKSE